MDGRKEGFWKNATVNTSLGSPLYIGVDIHGSNADGPWTRCTSTTRLDAWQVEVLHGILSPPPTAGPSAVPTPVPSPLPSSLADAHVGADGARVPGQPRGLLPDDARQAGRRPRVGIPRQGMEARATPRSRLWLPRICGRPRRATVPRATRWLSTTASTSSCRTT